MSKKINPIPDIYVDEDMVRISEHEQLNELREKVNEIIVVVNTIMERLDSVSAKRFTT